jgi:prepilin-type N-terminal cleavage/methylation domain-containing protein
MMTRRPGHPRGFTLVELMIVVIVIGILALIAIPRYRDARHRAFEATLKSDLKNLANQQELHYRDANRYASSMSMLEAAESKGVTITINEATNEGWAAIAVHQGLSDQQCGIYSGKADPAGADPADRPGIVTCSF